MRNLGRLLALLGLSFVVLASPRDEQFSFARSPQPANPTPTPRLIASTPGFSPLSALVGGDTCNEAIPISAIPFTDTNGTTNGKANDSTNELRFACGFVGSGPLRPGPDVFYSFTILGPGNSLTFSLDPKTPPWDPAIYVLGVCPNLDSCVIAADQGNSDFTETLTVSNLAAGTYYFGVDSSFPVGDNEADGDYTLTVLAGGSFGNTPTPTPTDTPTNTPTDTPTDTPTNTPTSTPTNTPSNTPTNTPTNTRTNTPTTTPTPTRTPTPTNTVTGTQPPTSTRTPTPTPTQTPTPLPPGFYTVAPCRVADTREKVGPFGGPSLQAGTFRSFTMTGSCGVPLNATAVAVNVTVAGPTAPGHLTVFPAASPLPLASTLNYSSGQTRGNNAIVPVGTGGAISVFCGQGSGTTDFIIDVNGFFISPSGQ